MLFHLLYHFLNDLFLNVKIQNLSVCIFLIILSKCLSGNLLIYFLHINCLTYSFPFSVWT